MSAGEETACIMRSENRGCLLQTGSNKLQYGVLFPSLGWWVVGREPDVGDDGDDGLSCGGIRILASVIETDDVSATSSSETVDLTVTA